MKKSRRTITVDGNKYVWWYKIGAGLSVVIISPFRDKTTRARIEFQDTERNCDYGYCFTFPLYVVLEKNGERYGLKLIEPGMAALLAMYLSHRELFKARKEIILQGYELLADMGYNIIRIENGADF